MWETSGLKRYNSLELERTQRRIDTPEKVYDKQKALVKAYDKQKALEEVYGEHKAPIETYIEQETLEEV